MMLKKLLKNESTSLILVLIGIFFLGFAVITFLWLDIEFDTDTRIKSEKFGQFGDFIGGIVGSLWALAGVLLFYIALKEQRKDFVTNREVLNAQTDALKQQIIEFELQREELAETRKVFKIQSDTLKIQQFESNFYSLLDVYVSIKDKLNNLDKDKDYFKCVYEKLMIQYSPNTNIVTHNEDMISSYTKIFNEERGHLSHYFKSFYRILKVIDTNHGFKEKEIEKEKMFYAKILRSQLTDYEQLVLFYNSHSIYGLKARPLILNYNLLKHTPLFNKPEFKFFLSIQKNNDILFFADYLNNFLTKHINAYYDLSFDKDEVVEKFELYDCLVGIYFHDKIELKIFCKKDITQNRINLTDEQFACFIFNLLSDRIIFSTYIEPNKVELSSLTIEVDENKIFSVLINTEAKLNLNFDKF